MYFKIKIFNIAAQFVYTTTVDFQAKKKSLKTSSIVIELPSPNCVEWFLICSLERSKVQTSTADVSASLKCLMYKRLVQLIANDATPSPLPPPTPTPTRLRPYIGHNHQLIC